MKRSNKKDNRITFLSWILIPILGIWILTGYLIGVLDKPDWQNSNSIIIQASNNKSYTSQFNDFTWQNTGLITVWFDDAWISQYSIGSSALFNKKLQAVLSVYVGGVGGDDYMNWSQIKKLQYNGWEITSHSLRHNCEIASFSDQTMISELQGSKLDLENQGFFPTIFVPPCGYMNQKMIDTAKRYYIGLRTSNDGENPIPVTNPYNLLTHEVDSSITPNDVKEWINDARDNKQWLILMFHKIDYSNERFSTTPEKFNQMLNEVVVSKLPVVLPSQVLAITR